MPTISRIRMSCSGSFDVGIGGGGDEGGEDGITLI